MARQPVKPKRTASIRERKFRRPKIDRTPRRTQRPGQRQRLPSWLWALLAVVVLGLLGGGAWLLWRPGDEAPTTSTPTVSNVTPAPAETTPELTPATPTIPPTATPTATATPTPTPTPVPQICQIATANAWARTQPTEQSTGVALLHNGDEVGIIAQVQNATGELWYQVVGYRIDAYLPAAAVLCPTP